MPEVADQTDLATVEDALTGAADLSFRGGSNLLSSALMTDPHMPSQEAALDALVAQVNAMMEDGVPDRILLAEGWAAMTGFPADADDVTLWRRKVEAYHSQHLELVAGLQAAFPTLLIQPFSLATALVALLDTPAAEKLTTDLLFTQADPRGTDTLTGLAELLTQAAVSDIPLPAGAPEDLPERVTELYTDLAPAAWDLVGGTLVLAPTPLPPETGDITLPAPADPGLVVGTDADDRFVLTDTMTRVDGGAGTDTLIVAGRYADSTIAFGAEGEVLFDPGPEAPALTLQDVERIAFRDGTLAFDDEGLAGQAYRLYQACFDRTPDPFGLGFWIKQLDAGNVTLTEAADFFLTSQEFANVYGEPDTLADVHYLALLYANVLNRVPDQDGFGFWRAQQDNGITRADMLVHFSESTENKSLVAEAIDDGIWYL